MELEKFYKAANRIVLHPGSIEDLNQMEGRKNYGKEYEEMTNFHNKKFITGIMIPDFDEIKEYINIETSGVNYGEKPSLTTMLGVEELGRTMSETVKGYETIMEEFFKEKYSNPDVESLDIRMRAIERNADGLVHFQLYNASNNLYMGVPVRALE